jgi:predicted DsbA family dithiol-disulfide isomerase
LEIYQQQQEEDSTTTAATTLPVEVEWRPFVIDPGTDPDGEDLEAYCARRWGGSGWTRHLRREGRKSGANFADWRWWPSTWKVHQFVEYGKEFHGDDTDAHRLKSVLFEALYESGYNPSSVEALVGIARSQGWDDIDRLRRYLEDDVGLGAVHADIQAGRRQYGVSSVPYFVVGIEPKTESLPYGLSGAQPASAFVRIFHELASTSAVASGAGGTDDSSSSHRGRGR